MYWTPIKFKTFDPMHWISDEDHLIWRGVDYKFEKTDDDDEDLTVPKLEYKDKYLWYAGDLPGEIFTSASNPPADLDTPPRPGELRPSKLKDHWIITDKPDIEVCVEAFDPDAAEDEQWKKLDVESAWFNYNKYERTITVTRAFKPNDEYPPSWENWYTPPEEETQDSSDSYLPPAPLPDTIRKWEVYPRYWKIKDSDGNVQKYLWNDGEKWVISDQLGCGLSDVHIDEAYQGNMENVSEVELGDTMHLYPNPKIVYEYMIDGWDVYGTTEMYVPKKAEFDSAAVFEGHASIQGWGSFSPVSDSEPLGPGWWTVTWHASQPKKFHIYFYKHGHTGNYWWSNDYFEGIYQGRGMAHQEGGENRSLFRVSWKLEGYVRISDETVFEEQPSPEPDFWSYKENVTESPAGLYQKFKRIPEIYRDGRIIEHIQSEDEFCYIGKFQWKDQFDRKYVKSLLPDNDGNRKLPVDEEDLELDEDKFILGSETVAWSCVQNINPGDNAQWSDLPRPDDYTEKTDELFGKNEYDPKYRESNFYSALEAQSEVVRRNWGTWLSHFTT